MSAYDCRAHRESVKSPFISSHTYDRISGWCLWNCGCRKDGRVVTHDGEVIYPGQGMEGDELAAFRAWALAENDRMRQEAIARGRVHHLRRRERVAA